MEWWLGHAGRVAAPAPLFFAWQPACSCGMLDCAVPGHIHGDMVGDRVCMKKKKIIMIIISSLRIIMIFIMIMAMAMAMIITKIKMKRTRKKEKEKNNGHRRITMT